MKNDTNLNVVVIGLGSMGKRRIRLIKKIYPKFIIYGVDKREDRRKEVESEFHIFCSDSIENVAENYTVNVAFVCTAPLSHSSIIKECLMKKWHVFTELNLVSDGYEDNIRLSKEKGCKLFLSSTFLYREETKYINSFINNNESKWNYNYHIGQYLPDWHPWETYKDFFIGDKRTNGCREIMAIEFPWLIATFGKVEKMHVISSKMTNLNIDYNDNYLIQFVHENGNKGNIIVDVVSPVAVRKFEAYKESDYIKWDGTPDTLESYDRETDQMKTVSLNEVEEHKDGYRKFVVENAYENEIREFFDVVLKDKVPLYGFEKDLDILEMIDKVEVR